MWSAVLFVREERLRLECNSRVAVSKWEAREGNVASKVKVPITPQFFFRLIKSSY